MEEEEKKQEDKQSRPTKKRRVSLFKRRKKSDIRPFVRERKHREYKKLISNFALVVVLLFILAAILYGVREYVIPNILHKNTVILNPAGATPPDNNQIQNILQNHGLAITGIQFATDSATLSFYLDDKVQVFISKEKDIVSQLDMVEAIDKQMVEDGKQAFTIDLRYNKPIVKY